MLEDRNPKNIPEFIRVLNRGVKNGEYDKKQAELMKQMLYEIQNARKEM